MVRLVCFSDSHGHANLSIPDGDVLIFAGDYSAGRGSIQETLKFGQFIESLPHKHKIIVAGNHDFPIQKDVSVVKLFIPNAIYLQDNEVVIENIKFYGSPYSPEFGHWAFNLPRGKHLHDKWAQIPDDTNVLITHGPPHGILDEVSYSGDRVGCWDLLDRANKLANLKCHLFGHIHEQSNQIAKVRNRIFANVSICDDNYNVIHNPVVIDL